MGFNILIRDETDDALFNEAVWGRVFNARRNLARRPRAVCRPSTADDVVRAVQLARSLRCRASVRAGGHSWAVWSVRSDAVLVDLVDLDAGGQGGNGEPRRIQYDSGTKIVSCSPSVTSSQLNEFLAKQDGGRMFAGGHAPDVGLGGFLLQGGMGWNAKNWGWACESVIGIDVVTADGIKLHCSTAENSDLFWAARGAGPGFPAIVTRFHLLTRPLYSLFQNLYIYPISQYKEVLQWVIDLCPTADPDTEIVSVSTYLPGEEEAIILAGCTTFKPTQEAAAAALRPIHESASRPPNPKVELFCQPSSLTQEYESQIKQHPAGRRFCSDCAYVSNDADVVSALEKAFTTVPTRESYALYFSMNPTSRRPLPDMALSLQTDHYFSVYSVWKDEVNDPLYMGWVQDVMREVERHCDGSFLADADFQQRRTKFWSEEAGKRLQEVRRKWDPEGVICGYLDEGDKSGVDGLKNEFEWK